MDNHILTSHKYRSDIDGLRAVAIFIVVGFHLFPRLFHGGFIGVDVFFVISGFLISTLLFEQLDNNTFRFIDFYHRRIKRIVPSLCVILLFSFIFGWLVLLPNEYQQLGKHIAGGAGFISNLILWRERGYFDNSVDTKPLLHLWSLGIEEQFYILWPIFLWVFWKRKFNIFIVVLVIALTSFLLNLLFIRTHTVATFYLPITRFWELLCGSMVGWLLLYKPHLIYNVKNPRAHFFLINSCSFLGILFIIWGLINLSKNALFPGTWALLPVIGASLIIIAGPEAWINRKLLSHKVMTWFGLISFPLYLWHWPLFSFALIAGNEVVANRTRVIIVILSIFLAWCTYFFIEKPIRWNKKAAKYTVLLPLGMMCILGVMGLYINNHNGLINHSVANNSSPELASVLTNRKVSFYPCNDLIPELKKLKFDGSCLLSKMEMPQVLFLGDSHILHYKSAIWQFFDDKPVLMIAQTSCLPFSSHYFLHGSCKEKYEAVLSFIEKNTSIKKVYVSGYWAYLMTGGFSKNRPNWRQTKPVDEQGKKSFLENGATFFNRVLAAKKEIIFLKDVPDLDFNINTCFKERLMHLSDHVSVKKNCWIDFANYKKRVRPYDEVIAYLLAQFPQVKTYNPRPIFCKKNKCMAKDEYLPYYFNSDHLNNYGATLVVEDLRKKLG